MIRVTNFLGDRYHKGKQIKEYGYNNDHSFNDYFHIMMHCFPKVVLNKFDGLNLTSWVD